MSNKPTSIRLTDEEKAILKEMAEQYGVSQNSLIRLLLNLGARILDESTIKAIRQSLEANRDD